MMPTNGRPFALTGQIIASPKHSDKALNSLLVVTDVEICAEADNRHLACFFCSDDPIYTDRYGQRLPGRSDNIGKPGDQQVRWSESVV